MRRTLSRGLLLVPILAAFMVGDASAQRWKWDLGVYGGYSWFSPLLDEEDTDLPDDAAGAEVQFDAGWNTGIQFGYNFSPKIGLRLNNLLEPDSYELMIVNNYYTRSRHIRPPAALLR